MSLIFSPLTEDVLEGPFKPLPKSVFLMLQIGKGVSKLEEDMEKSICATLKQKRFNPIKATTVRGHKDYLEKIIQAIRGCGFATAIFSEYTPAPTLANIFFEVALCNLLGKPVIIVKTNESKAPSDFVRTEWVTYTDGKDAQLKKDFSDSVSAIAELANYYEKLGDIAMEAEDIDLELAYERYKQSLLITNKASARKKINAIFSKLNDASDPSGSIKPARSRLKKSVAEFCKLLP